MNEQFKVWVQTLVSPAALLIIGFYINNTLQEQQRSLDKIKLTEQMVREAFDSNNPDKALALTRIIYTISDDKDFADELSVVVSNYYKNKAKQALEVGNEELYQQISSAAALFQRTGITISDSLKADPATRDAEEAIAFEKEGIKQIKLGDLMAAQENFKKAQTTYPGFRSSREISNLLTDKMKDVHQGKIDSTQANAQVLTKIHKDYAWKIDNTIASVNKEPNKNP